MTARLTYDSVSRVFHAAHGRVEALREVSLEVEPDSFTALVGPSGCGKTTLLNIASGLDTQYEGSYQVDPPDVRSAYLFQSPRLLPWRTARANVSFVLEAKGMPKKKAQEQAVEVLAMMGLTGFERHFPATLSGGMRQRVALARALVCDPVVMFMDEPFSALDELTARRLRGELLDLHHKQPRTVLFVTHHIAEACYLADRVVVMATKPGRITDDIPIDLPRPRDYDDPELAKYARGVTQAIFANDFSDVGQ